MPWIARAPGRGARIGVSAGVGAGFNPAARGCPVPSSAPAGHLLPHEGGQCPEGRRMRRRPCAAAPLVAAGGGRYSTLMVWVRVWLAPGASSITSGPALAASRQT
ncbi:hypothetical protein BRN99_00145 [Xanthomonas oryzae pv. oryzae]|nr:hypothetical protein BRO13_10225 [Xanthomonas oryzae pv. oryzae]RBK55937.1 hypothetical protein BRN99_00145 [Xanthomonas oryzae pv. oryzae]